MSEFKPLSVFAEIFQSLTSEKSHIGLTVLSLLVISLDFFIAIFLFANHFYGHQPIWLTVIFSIGLAIAWFIIVASFCASLMLLYKVCISHIEKKNSISFPRTTYIVFSAASVLTINVNIGKQFLLVPPKVFGMHIFKVTSQHRNFISLLNGWYIPVLEAVYAMLLLAFILMILLYLRSRRWQLETTITNGSDGTAPDDTIQAQSSSSDR